MNGWVIACIVIIVATFVYSYHRQFSYSIVATVTCGAIFAVMLAASDTRSLLYSSTFTDMGFLPHDLIDASRSYTILTSMFAHAGPEHLVFNLLALIFLGTMFEQKIGTRPFMVIYLVTGVCGTLLFAAFRWNEMVIVVGASGAISGMLGAFARLFPNERLFLFPMPFPMSIWVIALGFVGLQLIIALVTANVAVEAHVGGFASGLLVAPYVAKLPLHQRVKRMVSLNALRQLAKTPELKSMMRRIEDEEIPDVRSAWIEEYLSKARCPHCGARIKVSRETITCERGHML
jgi:membrane associated rhomboid family serine protease